jgi:cyclopropane-fatty-acyl-phospholipid synthase
MQTRQTPLHLIVRRCCAGALEFVAPGGRRWRLERGTGPHSRVLPSVLQRVLRNRGLVFAEAYADGDWEPLSATLADVPGICVRNLDHLQPGAAPVRWSNRARAQPDQFDTRRRARVNVRHYYGIDPAVYRRFLDRDLRYSCVCFRCPDDTLEAAQQSKCAHIAAKLDLEPRARALETSAAVGAASRGSWPRTTARTASATPCPASRSGSRPPTRPGQPRRVPAAGLSRGRRRVRCDRQRRHVRACQPAAVRAACFRRVPGLFALDGTTLRHASGRYSVGGGTDPWVRKYVLCGDVSRRLGNVRGGPGQRADRH